MGIILLYISGVVRINLQIHGRLSDTALISVIYVHKEINGITALSDGVRPCLHKKFALG